MTRTCFNPTFRPTSSSDVASTTAVIIGVCSFLLSNSHKNPLASAPSPSTSRYAVVVDAGSSGSRVRIYNWTETDWHGRLPNISERFWLQKNPGVSSYAHDERELRNYVVGLIDFAVKTVPEDLHKKTPVYFLATAGMRFLLEEKANEAMELIGEMLSNKSINPFVFDSVDNARILSGEEEGVFAWIAANYLDNAFSTYGHRQKHTHGVLELGGASTQIVFQPLVNVLANKFPVEVAGATYNLYAKSYLNYGQDKVDKWIKERLYEEENGENFTIRNPCMLRGHENADIIGTDKINVTFVGTGQPSICLAMLQKLVYNPVEMWRCSPQPCAIGTAYQPTIRASQRFYAVGAFIYSLEAIGVLSSTDDGRFTPEDVYRAARNFCSQHIDSIKSRRNATERNATESVNRSRWSPSERNNHLSKNCLVGLYMPLLFTKGYGFSNSSRQISAQKKVGGQSVEWALGAVIYDHENSRCKTPCQHRRHPSLNLSPANCPASTATTIQEEKLGLLSVILLVLTSLILY